MNINDIFGHAVAMTHGMIAGYASVILLYLVGFALARCVIRDMKSSTGDLIAVGAAIFVVWCWYGTRWGVSISILVNCFFCFLMLCFLALLCFRRVPIADLLDWRSHGEWLINFALF